MPSLNFSVFIDKVERGLEDIAIEQKTLLVRNPALQRVKPKRKTIRPIGKRKYKVGDTLYLYTGLRTKNCRKLGKVVCKGVVSIRIVCKSHCQTNNYLNVFATGRALTIKEQVKLAKDDGFETLGGFYKFFISQYMLYPGDSKSMQIVRW